ncbi:MAG: nickel pincer cofactor biosynthesis protein LarC [Deltaproteobacteria bacterium]|nr:nickel pincer cofactor biosynthesis protein LarC [Deltaproteobacteria bacterium]
MERLIFLDIQAGCSGDMLVGALLDLGAPLDDVRRALEGLGPIQVAEETVQRGALAARRFVVRDPTSPHTHRTHADVAASIEAAPLPPRVRERALGTFARLAEAEGRVHGVPPERVTFHEVGAIDSIADVVGACAALESLGVDRIVAGPVPLSGGTVLTQHGRLPLPAPATLHLLEGWPVCAGPGPGEHVTPTGAALLAALAVPGEPPAMVLRRTGTGAGSREDGPLPNVLRALLGEVPPDGLEGDEVAVLETQVDDLPGAFVPPILEACLAAGALDVFATPVLMKKGRPGLLLTALASPGDVDSVARILLGHGSTLGVRVRYQARRILDRRFRTVATPYGPVRVKEALLPGAPPRPAPEYEDCALRAREHGVPVWEVHRAALAAAGHDDPSQAG